MPHAAHRVTRLVILSIFVASTLPLAAQPAAPPDLAAASMAAVDALVETHGAAERERIERGVGQVADYWRADDGSAEDFRAFVEAEFLPRGDLLDRTFDRFEFAMERVGGYFASLGRDLRRGVDLEIGPLLPLDRRLGAWSPGAHVADDLFANKIAFVALLNFPDTSLATKLAEGGDWTRREWAETRLAGAFAGRVPAEVTQQIGQALSVADSYINGYNVFMHHLVDDEGRRLFPSGLRLISHWGLRDELKARYADPEGLARQRTIQQVFDRIVRQEIPELVIGDPRYDWNPFTNEVTVAPADSVSAAELESAGLPADARLSADAATAADLDRREPDTRYERWLGVFQAMRLADPYSPDNPTFVDRRFNANREIPEEEVEALFVSVLSSPLSARVGEVVAERLGRPLEPFDVWYVGFKPRGAHSESDLDALTKARYPSADAFADDIPRLLVDLGFAADRARFVADHVVVEPSRGAGHAFGAARRDDAAHLRTRVGADGMDYKGYNIAVHELGHNVEQVFGVTEIDHTLLQGVPNTAFTEALAFTFQNRDLELLGLAGPGEEAADLAALDSFWSTREIAGVALTDMRIWRWLYDNPEASPAEMREAVVRIARGVWNEFNAPIFGSRDETLLAVYSHMVDGAMYTPDYPLGHLIAFQIERFFETSPRPFGVEFERVAKLGQLTPDAWMRQAVGGPLSAAPLLAATEAALARFEGGAASGGLEAMVADEPRVRSAATSIGLEPPIAVEEGLASSPDGTPIHYLTVGEGEPAAVLIHCWGCDASYWNWQLAALAAERRVVAIDLAGHGASGAEREEWTMEAFGADVAAVVEALGISRAVLVGHSMGGYVMLAAAEQMAGKVVGLVAVDTLNDVDQEYQEEAIANYLAALRRDFPNTVRGAMRQYFPPDADPAVVEAVITDMAETEPAVGVSAFEHIIAYDTAGALDRLGLPLRAVQATMQPTVEAHNRRHVPSYEASYLDGVGHWPMFEDPAAFEAALVARVEELAAGANAGP